MERTIIVEVSLNGLEVQERPIFCQGDKNTHFLSVRFMEDVDLTGYTLQVYYLPPYPCVTPYVDLYSEVTTNPFKVPIPNKILERNGQVKVEFSLSKESELITVNKTFNFEVIRTINGTGVTAYPEGHLKETIAQQIEKIKALLADTDNKITEYNNNATEKTTSFNNNYDEKLKAFNSNDAEKTSTFNDNADSKLKTYNDNDTLKTDAYNDNHTKKMKLYNDNSTKKVEEYNKNSNEKKLDFDNNVTQKTNEFDNHVNDSKTDIDNYKNDIIKPEIDNYIEKTSKVELNNHVETVLKKDLDKHTIIKKADIDETKAKSIQEITNQKAISLQEIKNIEKVSIKLVSDESEKGKKELIKSGGVIKSELEIIVQQAGIGNLKTLFGDNYVGAYNPKENYLPSDIYFKEETTIVSFEIPNVSSPILSSKNSTTESVKEFFRNTNAKERKFNLTNNSNCGILGFEIGGEEKLSRLNSVVTLELSDGGATTLIKDQYDIPMYSLVSQNSTKLRKFNY